MKFETPAGTNPIDQGKVIGKPTHRIEGPLKTTGKATYAAEWHTEVPNAAHGYIVGAAIAKGRIKSIDLSAAKAAAGVITIVTAANAGALDKAGRNAAKLLGGPDIQHYHQAVALVVAQTFEQAVAASHLVRIDYDRADDGKYVLAEARDAVKSVKGRAADQLLGDFEGAFAAAPVKLDATYTTTDHAHAMMEPFATIASWEGDKLTLRTSNQMIDWCRTDVAKTLKMPKADIRVHSPYVGGGFGGKLFLRADAVLAALGAKAAGRPVKVVMQRELMFNNSVHRHATIQKLRIGAGKDGRITALDHEGWSGNLPGGDSENAVNASRSMYAGANRMMRNRLALLDLPEGNAMRAPGEAVGSIALEVAMDELAEKLGMDPIALRVLNDSQVDPAHPEKSFSLRKMVECLTVGAKAFGWNKRSAKPGARRDGQWLVGMGVAAALRDSPVMTSGARVRLSADGRVTVETDMTDIGTGSYTVIAQTAAEMLGVGLDRVAVKLGDSDFPVSSGSGGQWGANSSTSGVYAACVKLREAVAAKLGIDPATATFAGGKVSGGGKSATLVQAAAGGEVVGEDSIEFGGVRKQMHQSAFGAHFVEVGVDSYTGEIRLRRMLAVCSAGRILNPISARSQVIGAMTMGSGAVLSEELVVDPRFGHFVNHDLAQYEVLVHADVPHQEVIFLPDLDPASSPMKAHGVGELGICGVGGAVANAVYNATGVRLRDFPMTVDKVLAGLPELV